jgi:hypothetical protein
LLALVNRAGLESRSLGPAPTTRRRQKWQAWHENDQGGPEQGCDGRKRMREAHGQAGLSLVLV